MPPVEPVLFPYGVASFEPTATGVLLWTRSVGADPVCWEVATDPDFADVVASGRSERDQALAVPSGGDPDDDDPVEVSHTVEVTGLAAGTDHFYRFRPDAPDGGDGEPAWSPTGRTRTLPDGDDPVRIGLACCGDYSAGHFAAYRALAEADVDLVIHLGDYVYADPEGTLRDADPEHDAVTQRDYRSRYQQNRLDPDLQALHQRHPMFSVIDDHDLADNANREGSKHHDPETQGDWADRFEAATSERRAWLPIREDGPAGREAPGEYRAVELGTLGELLLLDTRLSGRDTQVDDDDAAELDDEDRHLLGAGQMDWVRSRIVDRAKPWSIVVSSVVVNDMSIELPGSIGVNESFPSGYLIQDGTAINTDGWDGYPAERRRLAAALRQRGTGGVILSGDVHSAWAFEGPTDDQGAVAVELTCPAVTSKPMGEMVPVLGKGLEAYMRSKDDVAWADLYARGHLVVDVTRTSVTGTWYFSDSEDPAAEARRGSSWATHLDRPGRLEEVDADPEHPGESTDETDGGTGTAASDGATGGGASEARERLVPGPVPPRPRGIVAAELRSRRRRRLVATAAVTAVILLWERRRGDG